MLKAYWEVTAGMHKLDVDPALSRRFEVTAEDWAKGRFVEIMFAAQGYAANLQLRAASGMAPNVVLVEFIWL